jgi:probable rRNA maturation factor
LASASVRRLAEAMLAALGLESAELSVLLTDDRRIHALNLRHRQKDRPTDVLAFPLDDASVPVRWLGDVVISLDTAQRQADSRRRPLLAEVRFLLAHGLLHLVGHDHDTAPRKRKMDAMARRLVRSAAFEPVKTQAGRGSQPRGRAQRRQK